MLRTIRSYVRRAGRMTPKQASALNENSAFYSLDLASGSLLNLNQIFGREAPKILEIGFGMGQSLAQMALNQPEHDFLGLEVHRPGLGALVAHAKELGLTNLRVIEADAVKVLNEHVAEQSFDKIQIFFPDPWPKKRHHKRRLIQPDFVDLLCTRLKPNGYLHLATDWQDYALQMMTVLSNKPELKNTAGCGIYAINTDRPETKFERRGRNLGHSIWDLVFIKTPPEAD
ncbi:MAG TPA: tRNA (guanosine(46)-N7)-methyltransferase TrmB [Coxiellaceae bacterium]|nr:tRNA (guanosine(46)-N7)-methyltransferase TrmB [Coxiellaceae bacterium]